MRPTLLLALLACACSATVDGAPSDFVTGTRCETDLDCGAGRHCDGGLCAFSCAIDRDCGPTRSCSPCGRCVLPGAQDEGCLPAIDRPCVDDTTCRSSLGSEWACAPTTKTCTRTCANDLACAELGRGFGCDGSLCARRCTREDECWHHGFRWSCVLPAGVDPVANADSATPAVGTCAPDDERVRFPAGEAPAAKLAGIYGMLLVSAVRTEGIKILTRLDTFSIQLHLVRATRDGDALVLQEKLCTTELRNFNDDDRPALELFKVVLPDVNLAAVRALQTRIEAVPAPGGSFVSAEQIDLRGAKLTDRRNGALPTYKDLMSAWDQERDGHPGLTAKVTGAVTGDLYQAQRWVATLYGTVVDYDHLHGLAKGRVDQTVLGATAADLINDGRSTEHPQGDRSYFRMLRLASSASCADVVRVSRVDGSWLSFVEHFDPAARP
jgi:hypothetical protein